MRVLKSDTSTVGPKVNKWNNLDIISAEDHQEVSSGSTTIVMDVNVPLKTREQPKPVEIKVNEAKPAPIVQKPAPAPAPVVKAPEPAVKPTPKVPEPMKEVPKPDPETIDVVFPCRFNPDLQPLAGGGDVLVPVPFKAAADDIIFDLRKTIANKVS